jgi:hypothetical protein
MTRCDAANTRLVWHDSALPQGGQVPMCWQCFIEGTGEIEGDPDAGGL